jgi:cell division protein FtsZ
MANAKQRASMREGPLAALFRKTEEEDQLAAASANAGQDVGSEPQQPQTAAPSAAIEPSAPEPPARQNPVPQPPIEPAAEGSAAGRLGGTPPLAGQARSSAPHPSLGAPTEVAPNEQAAGVPSPKERLLQAFSSEIPANVMERPAPATSAGRMHVYEQPALPGRADGSAGHPVIRVVGVGGAGTNAVNRMVEAEVAGVEFIAVNTDLQSLQQSSADVTVHIGVEITRGLGSGSDANVGRQAAMDDYDSVKALLKGSDMVFIAAGAGGGTGTGAAPIVARIAQEVGALTVAIVTRPFGFEGSRRAEQASHGIDALAEEVDTLIVVPNNRLLSILDKQTSMVDAFRVADDVLRQGVQGISDLVTLPGLINLDFADVRTIMCNAGNALLGIGMGVGENRAIDAAMQAVSSPLLETSMEGARSILLSITGGTALSLWEVNEAAKAVSQAAHPDANIIFGAMVDEKLDDQVWVTVVATGYGEHTAIQRLREPTGEPRIIRNRQPHITDRRAGGSQQRRGGLRVDEYDVPEFVPPRV